MEDKIPLETIQAFARSISKEASKYGFRQLDMIRLVNELMDSEITQGEESSSQARPREYSAVEASDVISLPIAGKRLMIRTIESESDIALLESWLSDKYGRFFVLSATGAHSISISELISEDRNHVGIVTTLEDEPIGAVAFLDHDVPQRRAELRKLIGAPAFRGKGYAEEATRLWIDYGVNGLELEKIHVSTLQTHLSNIRVNEKIGFQVEGLLRDEVLIDGVRHDVLRMGYCKP